jgi:hypothetical protein
VRGFYFSILTLLFWFLLVSCRPVTVVPKSSKTGRDQFNSLFATNESEGRIKARLFHAIYNEDYNFNFDGLPKSGEVASDKVPYVGSWYPQKYGGTSRDSGLGSPLKKYDKAFSAGTTKAHDWERKYHTVASGSRHQDWAGHCNGYSASAQRHAEPRNSVKRGAVIFTPLDIKALLAEVHMSAKFYFLGGNRCALSESARLPSANGRGEILALDDCDDVNPGTFHLAIANWIGLKNQVIIMDRSPKDQVWNFPYFKYATSFKSVSASEAMRLVSGVASTSYKYNLKAANFRSVTTTVTHAVAYETESLTKNVLAERRHASQNYTYIIELDDYGRIIGGEWTGESVQKHPDFIWVAFEPVKGDGGDFGANPYVDHSEVIKLWAESVGADPTNPPMNLMEPKVGFGWGDFAMFSLSINESQSGAVFSGRPALFKFERKERLHGDISVQLNYDGKAQPLITASGSEDVQWTLEPEKQLPGISTLEVTWLKEKNVLSKELVRIHVQ